MLYIKEGSCLKKTLIGVTSYCQKSENIFHTTYIWYINTYISKAGTFLKRGIRHVETLSETVISRSLQFSFHAKTYSSF